jgi:hypothetical protein
MSKQITRSTREVKVPAQAARPTASLESLIQQWRAVKAECDTVCDTNSRACDAAEKALPKPDKTITKRDPILADVLDWDCDTLNGAAWPQHIERAIRNVVGQSSYEEDYDDRHAFIVLKSRRPLTTEQIELKTQLEARLATATEYHNLHRRECALRGCTRKTETIIDRYSDKMLRLEKKIAKHRCRDIAELRAMISFVLELVDRDGFDSFCGNEDIARSCLQDALSLAASPANFTTRGH